MPFVTEKENRKRAAELVGNWMGWPDFRWDNESEISCPELWCILPLYHRDSDLLDISNGHYISRVLRRMAMLPRRYQMLSIETFASWTVGWITQACIRVFIDHKRRCLTRVFRKYVEIEKALRLYPVLDEDDYRNRHDAATRDNITTAAFQLLETYVVPQGWQYDVIAQLAEEHPEELETAEHGAWPREDLIEAAFIALGYSRISSVACPDSLPAPLPLRRALLRR